VSKWIVAFEDDCQEERANIRDYEYQAKSDVAAILGSNEDKLLTVVEIDFNRKTVKFYKPTLDSEFNLKLEMEEQ